MTDRKSASAIGSQVLEYSNGAAILGGKNYIANPGGQINNNFWSTDSVMSAVPTNNGVELTGDGYRYQTVKGLTATEGYMALVYVHSVTGTWTMTMGDAFDDASLGTITLVTGWNEFRFTAGATDRDWETKAI